MAWEKNVFYTVLFTLVFFPFIGVLGMERKKVDLDDRLIELAVRMITVAEHLPKTVAGNHLAGQLIRSGTAPALQYGEARAAESKQDFIHKMKVALKELRESYNCVKIIRKMNWHAADDLHTVLDENNQLISIFIKSITTAQNNKNKKELEDIPDGD